ncbi:MAG: AMP-binding protein [Actinobacteria bacterium]|nr:AMP-binding protein [Actinomycetota bacterium]
MSTTPLLPFIDAPTERPALIGDGVVVDYRTLAAASSGPAATIRSGSRVAIPAAPTLETCVAAIATLRAGATMVPINPKASEAEIEHVVDDCRPDLVACAATVELPASLAALPRLDIALDAEEPEPAATFAEPDPEEPGLILYTSGTTGPPKGAVISRRALTADIDGLAAVWRWTADDVVAHSLPLNHAHGLVLGVLGPLRLGGATMLLGHFDPSGVGAALRGPATMYFGVPTMYRRLRAAAEGDPDLAAALGSARLLASGSAALPAAEHEAIERLTGLRVVERYGMTETLITIAAHADGPRRPGQVGHPIPGVEIRLVDDDLVPLAGEGPGEFGDPEEIGEIEVRGATLFDGYLDLPAETAAAFHEGWFRTGDLASRDTDGSIAILGRRAGDLIKSGGYRIGAGEIEAAILTHPDVAEAAVTGEPDPDLGERVVAWVVAAEGRPLAPADLTAQAESLLARHKQPREFRFLDQLPRNDLGKVQKSRLISR